jgi:hypothetical protein
MSNLPPSGEIPRGAIRFNTDSNKPELWDGSQWAEFQLSTPNLGRSVDTQPGARGILAGGYVAPANTAKTSYINISSAGDSQDFGDLSVAIRYQAGCSSSTRGLTFGGYSSSGQSTITKTTIASTGSHATFGNIVYNGSNTGFYGHACFSNQTRAIKFSGNTGSAQPVQMNYVTIASDGNTSVFGDMTYNYRYGSATGSKTRAMPMGGYDGSGASNVINVITMSTTGDAQDFGDLSETMSDGMGTTTNGTRSLVHTRNAGFTDVALDSYSPISGGTTISFGNLSFARQFSPMNSCLSSPTRGVFPGGMSGPAATSGVIDYVEFATEGNAVDFGDMHTAASSGSYFSSAHGGL